MSNSQSSRQERGTFVKSWHAMHTTGLHCSHFTVSHTSVWAKSSNVTQKHLKTWISGTGRFKWAFVFKSRPRVSVVNGVISRRLNSASFFDDYFNWLHHLSVTADEEPIPVWELWKHNRYWGMRWVTATCRSRSDVLFSLFRWWKSTLAP